MSNFDAIVIGAGINGLVAGATLARRGKRVCIVEQREKLGGMATLAEGEGPALAHLLYNLSPRAMADIGLDPKSLPFRATPLPTVALCPAGQHVILRGHKAQVSGGTAHPDADAVQALLERLTAYGDILLYLAEGAPPGGQKMLSAGAMKALWRYAGAARGAKRLGKAGIRQFLQVLLSNAHDLILDEMPDGPLAGLLAADAVRGAAAGPRSPGSVFNLIYRMGHGGAVSLPAGGMPQVIDAIAGAAREAGCTVRTGEAVAEILVEEDRTRGVALTDGTTLVADAVLASAGAAQAMALTGPAHHDIESARRVRNLRARGTAAKVNLRLKAPLSIPGLDEDLSGSRLIFAPSADYVERAFNPAKYGEMPQAPVIEAVEVEAGGALWLSAIVQYAPFDLKGGWTNEARQKLTKITLDTLQQVIPELQDNVAETQVITPDQIEAATGAPGGHWHHAEMSLDQVLTLRPAAGLSHYRMGPKGLYLCGASSHPGGDVMGLAGRNAALALLEGGE